MLITLENGITVDLLFPEKTFYRITTNQKGRFMDFSDKQDAEQCLNDLPNRLENNYTLFKVTQSLDDYGKVTNTIFEEI